MTKEAIFNQVKRELEFIYGDEEICNTTTFDDLGMDSLDMVELISDMEERFDINADDFENKPESITELVDEIYRQKQPVVLN